VKISGLPLGSPGTKWHLGAGPMVKHIVYYKGEGGGTFEFYVSQVLYLMFDWSHKVR
jgi:hypothetical protein